MSNIVESQPVQVVKPLNLTGVAISAVLGLPVVLALINWASDHAAMFVPWLIGLLIVLASFAAVVIVFVLLYYVQKHQARKVEIEDRRATVEWKRTTTTALLTAAENRANHKISPDGTLEVIYTLPGRVRVQEASPEPEVLAIAAPVVERVLPTSVRYEDVRAQVPEDHALVGVGIDGLVTRERGIKALIWVVGGSGTGKTNTVTLRIEEDYDHGHGFYVIDPHWFKDDSLYNAIKGYEDRFVLPLASEPEDIIKVLDAFLGEFKRRKAGGRWKAPLTIIIDEVGSLVTDKPENKTEEEMIAKIKQVARICGQESRGFQMTGMYISQDAAGLAWLRKRAIMVLAHQLLMMSERLLACNENAEIARQMDTWPIGRTLVYGLGFKEGQRVVQQPMLRPRVVNSTLAQQRIPNTPQPDLDVFQSGRPEDIGKADGKPLEDDGERQAFVLKKFLSEARKMKAKGESNDAILKHFNLSPGGRNNQDLKAVLEMLGE